MRSSTNVPRLRAFTPTIRAPSANGAFELRIVVSLDQHCEVETEGQLVEVAQEVVVGQRGDDQQHGVGSDGARFVDLHLVDDEVFA